MARSQRLSAQITIGSVLERSVGINLKSIRGGLESIAGEIGAVTKRQKELDGQRDVLRRQGRSVDELDREYAELGRTLESLERKQRRWERAAAASRRVGSSFRSAADSVTRSARNIGVGVAGAATAVGLATAKIAGDINEVNQFAQRLSVSPEYLSTLNFVGRRFGVELEAIVDAIKEVQIRGDEFILTGKGGGAEAFERLGLSRKQLRAVSGDAEAMFDLVLSKLREVEDTSARQRIADEIFGGQGGEQLIEVLKLPEDRFRQIADEAVRSGAVITEEQARITREFTQSYRRIGTVAGGFFKTVATEAMPAVTAAFGLAGDELMANRDAAEAIGLEIGSWSETVIPIIGEFGSGLAVVSGHTAEIVSGAAELAGGWRNLGIIIGGAFAARTVYRIGRFVFEVGRLGLALGAIVTGAASARGALRVLGTIVRRSPIVAAAVAIAAGAKDIYDNWEGVGAWFSESWDIMGRSAQAGADLIGGLLSGDMDRAARGWRDGWDAAVDGAGQTWIAVGATFDSVWRSTIEPVLDLFGATDVVIAAWERAEKAIGAALDRMGAKFGRIWEDIKPMWEGLKAAGTWLNDSPTSRNPGGDSTIGAGPRPVGPGPRPQARRVGGTFAPGGLLVGEAGPELRYEDRAGFIADNRRTLAMAKAAAGLGVAPDRPRQSAPAASAAPASVVQNITIHAAGASAAAIADELERRRTRAQRGALYDRASGYGHYEGVA